MSKRVEFTERDVEQIYRMAKLGMPMKHIANVLGICKATLERRFADTPAITEALEKGRSEAAGAVYETAYNMATSGKVPAMTIFWLKAQEGWRDNGAIEEIKATLKATEDNVGRLFELARNQNKSVA